MIPRQQIIRTADRDGVPAPTVERDYVLSHVVASLAEDPGAKDLMFKGGTALQMCYFEDFRYSADLDLSVSGTVERAVEILSRALDVCRQTIGFPELALTDETKPRIGYLGPLGRQRDIKLDLDVGELVFPSERVALIRRYDDLADTPGLVTYGLDQIAAEKLRCVIQRLQCRDIYDLHALVHDAGVDVPSTWEMFEAKARHRGLDPDTFFDRLQARTAAYRARWADELFVHLGSDVPDFDTVLRQLRRHLRPMR